MFYARHVESTAFAGSLHDFSHDLDLRRRETAIALGAGWAGEACWIKPAPARIFDDTIHHPVESVAA
jgi:hypothetical protein